MLRRIREREARIVTLPDMSVSPLQGLDIQKAKADIVNYQKELQRSIEHAELFFKQLLAPPVPELTPDVKPVEKTADTLLGEVRERVVRFGISLDTLSERLYESLLMDSPDIITESEDFQRAIQVEETVDPAEMKRVSELVSHIEAAGLALEKQSQLIKTLHTTTDEREHTLLSLKEERLKNAQLNIEVCLRAAAIFVFC